MSRKQAEAWTAPGQKPPSVWAQPVRQAATVQWVACAGLGVLVLASLVARGGGWIPAGTVRAWEGVIPVLASVAVLAALATRLPLQNVLACGLLVALTAGVTMALGSFTGTPLGRYEFAAGLGPRLLEYVAWPVPFLWLAVVLSAHRTARVMLRPWRRGKSYGWWLLAVAAGLAWVLTLTLEPFGREVLGWWKWPAGATAQAHWWGAPLFFPLAAAGFVLGLLLVATPWLIAKRPTGLAPEYGPAVTWLALSLWAGLGGAITRQWVPAAIGLAGAVIAGILAWRGAQTPITASAHGEIVSVSAG